MMLDSAFSNLYDLMMEPVDVYKIWLPKFTFNGWMEPQHFCIHSSMGEVAVILKGTRDIGAIVGSRVANIYGLDILAEEI
ncbi:hypothetical protein AAZX31_11G183800 [Glycine max]